MVAAPRVREISISAAWHAGEIPSHLVTTAGEAIEVVHRGRRRTQFCSAGGTVDGS
jgi:hypothetical protein